MRKLTAAEIRAMEYLNKNGTSQYSEVRSASGSRNRVGTFLDYLKELGFVAENTYTALGTFFDWCSLTRRGKTFLKNYPKSC